MSKSGMDERIRRDREWTASTIVAALINRLGGVDQVIDPCELQQFRSSMPVVVTHMPDGSIRLQIKDEK